MTTDDFFGLAEDSILDDPRWPELVRVLRVDDVDESYVTLHVVGIDSGQHYTSVLAKDEVQALHVQARVEGALSGSAPGFRLATEAHRIRLAHLYDPLFAVSVSKIDPLPHQLEAVYQHMLPQPALRFMLADDPGAGKTIMAGLLLKELKLRGVVARTLIVVPSPLRPQWRREMWERFGERFDIVERATLDALGGPRAWRLTAQAITSIDFAKRPDVLESLVMADPWDLIVVDEAHKMSAYRRGPSKVEKSARYRLGEVLSEQADRLLMMTATPHKGDPENFRFLLSLIDPDLFADQEILQRAVEQKENPIFLRRLKEDMKGFNGKPLFPPRHARTVRYDLEGAEWNLYQQVTHYVEMNFNRALSEDNRNVTFALIVLQRRLASSVRAILRSLENRQQRLSELHDDVIRDPELLEQARHEHVVSLEDDEDLPEHERWDVEERALRYTVARNLEELEYEIEQLAQLIELAKEAEESEPERKLRELEGVMRNLDLKRTNDKLLIFTEAKDTLEYLVEHIRSWGFSVVTIDGSMEPDQRLQAEDNFCDEANQVMVATEAAGEGINLQFCHLMVNYDIPWNPTRMEQRLGRIHRYGQDREVFMYNLVARNTREGRVLEAVLEKLERMRESMGSDRVYDVVGERLAEARLENLIRDAVTNRRMFDDILASIDAVLPEDNLEVISNAALSSLVTPFVDVEAMRNLGRVAEENRLTPAYVREFFLRSLETLWPGRVEQRADGYWRIKHVPANLRDIPPSVAQHYGRPEEQYLSFTFDPKESRRTGVEFVGPGHSLFEAILHHTLTRFRDDLERGAAFGDLEGQREGLIWLIEGTVNDGQGATVGQQLFALYQPAADEHLEILHPSLFLDFEAPAQPVSVPDTMAGLLSEQGKVIGWSISHVLEPYRLELVKRRAREKEIVQRYLRESFDVLIARSEGLLMDYEAKQVAGKDMRIKILEEEKRNEDLRRRKEERLTRVEREQMLMLAEPRVIGVAAIMLVDKLQPSLPPGETPMRRDDEVERAAVAFVLDYEAGRGWEAEDLSDQHLPFDVRSRGPGGEIHYIEVKGRAGVGGVELSEREWLTAENLGPDYWLYIVTNATSTPQLHIIPDPVHNLPSGDIIKRTRYHVTTQGWMQATKRE
jgi:superfamily II DNA or RNA helicase